ncbi:hypothetical protein LIA77_10599 [Sarocladium implicatum]|jgi:hypothetical protein|nr:hypothetical protein LIA77_10599 [Sarocladium implicatum]
MASNLTIYHVKTTPEKAKVGEPFKIILGTDYKAEDGDKIAVYRDKYSKDNLGSEVELPVSGPTKRSGWGTYILADMVFTEAAKGQTSWDINFRFVVNDKASELTVQVEVEHDKTESDEEWSTV